MTASVWYPAGCTTTSTTDWNFASTTSSYNDTWHIRITFDTNTVSDDDFGDCGGYIP